MTAKGKALLEAFRDWLEELDSSNTSNGWFLFSGQRPRGRDKWGSGHYHASRGTRKHEGYDLAVEPGQKIYAPFDGEILREAKPDNKDHITGILISDEKGTEVKIFYLKPFHTSGKISKGDLLGHAQSLQHRYPGIVDHLHIEVRKNGVLQNPKTLLSL